MTEHQELQIARYLDGDMNVLEREAFEAECAQQPELAATFTLWRTNDAALRTWIADRPIDDALLVRLGLGSDPVASSATIIDFATARAERVVHAPQPVKQRWFKQRWFAGGAIAAAIALTVSIKMMTATPGLSNDPAFQVAMQQNATGQSTPIGNGEVVPVLSFAAADGRYCREYRVEGAGAESGIACRDTIKWNVEAQVQIATATDAAGIVAAAGASSTVIDAAYTRLAGADPMGAEQERAMIASGWRPR